jgi:hypothetical protein
MPGTMRGTHFCYWLQLALIISVGIKFTIQNQKALKRSGCS